MNGKPHIMDRIDKKSFFHGLLVVALVYVALFAVFWIKTPDTIAEIKDQLASQTVPIKRAAAVPDDTPAGPEAKEPLESVDLDAPREPTQPALVKAPIDGMYEWTEAGRLPQVRPKDKLTPFKAYKRPYAIPAGTPMIAVVLRDYGLSESASQKALDLLPPNVTFLLSPYSREPERWATAARENGHEIWLDVKFETAAYPDSDPGPQAILANSSLRYNQDRLHWNFTRASGYAGIGGRTDYIFDSATAILRPLIKSVYRRGLAYLELNPGASGLVETVAAAMGGPYVRADLTINGGDNGAMQGSPLKNLERLAKERGHAVGLLNPYEQSIEQIETWLAGLPEKGYALAPVSAVAEAQMKPSAQKPGHDGQE